MHCAAQGTRLARFSLIGYLRAAHVRTAAVVTAAFLVGTIAAGSGSLGAAWEPIVRFISLQDPPRPASANVLSEHELERLDEMPPQDQATLLLERSINHYQGANQQIARRVDGWRGRISLDERLNQLFVTAINSDDLTVRVAGIEIDLAARAIEKSTATVDRLEQIARSGEQGPRVNALWDLALIGNRGVDQAHIEEILLSGLHDHNENIRYWVVEGLAYLATDTAIAPLLDTFGNDPSAMIRERAACGLAQSGMFSAEQRRSAVPRLLDDLEDGALDVETRRWAFQALRDITGRNLPHDPAAWRRWYQSSER